MSGLIHIYTGDGKGKTTCAVGLAVRFSGNGGKVLFTQFLKDGSSSEIDILRQIDGVEVFSFTENLGFAFRMNDEQKVNARSSYNVYMEQILSKAASGDYGLLVLDELLAAWNYDFVDHEKILAFLKEKPKELEVVLTGRDPATELLNLADYVSDICKVKHPFDQGIMARKGIEM